MSGSAKHTPSSVWHVDQSDDFDQPRVLNRSGSVIAVLPEGSGHGPVISASPEMLEVIKAVIEDTAKYRGLVHPTTLRMADEVVARAEGRQP